MYVCICCAVTDRDIAAQVEQGNDSLEALRTRTGLGSQCGRCQAEAERVLSDLAVESTGGSAHHEA